MRIIKRDRSVIPACDVPLELYERIVRETADIEGIGGYKVGFFLGLDYGLPKIVEIARKYTDKPVIYDHQKAGTDIPDMGGKFAKICKKAGVDAVILFPQSGPETEKAWIEAAKEEGLGIIVGGLMTHPKYKKSE
ncbi:MAG: orotidine 5-phosphate decarboxylase, partial [Methanomicrobia archaeon]|nr:orotidine 5-phosphate decarboxylase [Methanomicrobia archaeon]